MFIEHFSVNSVYQIQCKKCCLAPNMWLRRQAFSQDLESGSPNFGMWPKASSHGAKGPILLGGVWGHSHPGNCEKSKLLTRIFRDSGKRSDRFKTKLHPQSVSFSLDMSQLIVCFLLYL